MFSLKVTNVALAGERATSVNCAKNCFVPYPNLLLHTTCPLCGAAIKCIPQPPTRQSTARKRAQQQNEYSHMKPTS